MGQAVLDNINEHLSEEFGSVEAALKSRTREELFDAWLQYEGIIGYAWKILDVMEALGFSLCEVPSAGADRIAELEKRVAALEETLQNGHGNIVVPVKEARITPPDSVVINMARMNMDAELRLKGQ